jgi:membrane protease YdiL (CAAX protease family)
MGLLVAGMTLVALLHPLSQLLARIVLALVFAGFLEEVFFRGYIQSRLNDSFGRPYSFHGVSFGAGLLVAAALFGLAHPLTALSETTPWAWALWTTTLGLTLGFLREKTGAVVTPAIVRGVILLPGVLFGAVGQ